MTEENNTSQSQQPAETEEAQSGNETEVQTQSLDDIANEFGVEEQAQQFQAQPQQRQQEQAPQQYQESGIPDPTYDPDGYTRYMQSQAAQLHQFNQAFEELANKVNGYEQMMAQQKVDADLSQAVNHINQKLSVEPEMAEVALEIEYRKNPAFKRIWDNREKNPAAFNKALDLISDKWSGKFATRADAQIAENVRAAKTSQQTLASTQQQDKDEEWSGLSPAKFERKWRQTKGS